jgi:hypothetical protein
VFLRLLVGFVEMALSLLQFFGVQHLLIGILLFLHHRVVAFVSDD